MPKQPSARVFLTAALALAIPIMLQNGITNLVSLVDNVMVGNLCTESMSGVSIANQMLLIFNLSIFGATSGAGIFTAQFHGRKDEQGIAHTLRYKLVTCLILTVAAMAVLWIWGENFIQLFLYESDQEGDLALTLSESKQYLRTMLLGLIPYTLSQCYASTLRETGESLLPMKAGIAAVCVNMALNYVLIFGKLGMPALGVTGAAIATATSRVVECGITIAFAHRNVSRFPYLKGLFTKWTLPAPKLLREITARAFPLTINEILWASATTIMTQSYATRGLAVVAAYNIHTTIYNVVSTSFLALGAASGIIIGNLLGANDQDGAMLANKRLSIFAICFSGLFSFLLIALSGIFPLAYETTDQVRKLASQFMIVGAIYIPVQAYLNVAYFTLRSGGRTGITLLFDCVFICGVNATLAYYLSRHTDLNAVYLFALVEFTNIFKAAIGFYLIRKRIWLKNLVKNH